MSSRPTRSPHFSNTAIENSPALPAENTCHCQYRDTSDYAFDPDKSDFGLASPSSPHREAPLWRRAFAALSPFSSADKQARSPDATPLLSPTGTTLKHPQKRRRRLRLCRCFTYLLLGFFVMLGLIQFVAIACGIFISFFPGDFDRATDRWRHPHDYTTNASISHWPTDISQDITPVQCHSHNDYWRRVPLFSALQAGCIGVEADVWLFDEDLYVGHTSSSLTPQRTLRNMYINPLFDILDRQNPITKFHPAPDSPLNGVFDTNPSQTLILLIDFKTDGVATWEYVVAQLAPLRERNYLTYFNGSAIIPGPITIVGTGNTPFNLITANHTYRDIFFDAPLELLADDNTTTTNTNTRRQTLTETTSENNNNAGQGLTNLPPSAAETTPFNWTNSYYASVSFDKSIGPPWTTLHLSERQIDTIRAQIRGAHRHGLKARYWSLPRWPRSLRNHLWSVLVREGVDILNVDDLESATRGEWRVSAGVGDSWWG